MVVVSTSSVWAQEPNSCAKLANFKAEDVEITKAAAVAAGTTETIPWNQTRTAPLPAYCRVEGVMNRHTGVEGEEFGITFDPEEIHTLDSVEKIVNVVSPILLLRAQ